MSLTKKQQEAVRLLFEGRLTHAQVAAELKISNRTLYNWKKVPEFNQAMIDLGNQTLATNVGKLMANMTKLAFKGKSEFVRLQATQYLLDKVAFGLRDQQQIKESEAKLRTMEAQADLQESAVQAMHEDDDAGESVMIVDNMEEISDTDDEETESN